MSLNDNDNLSIRWAKRRRINCLFHLDRRLYRPLNLKARHTLSGMSYYSRDVTLFDVNTESTHAVKCLIVCDHVTYCGIMGKRQTVFNGMKTYSLWSACIGDRSRAAGLGRAGRPGVLIAEVRRVERAKRMRCESTGDFKSIRWQWLDIVAHSYIEYMSTDRERERETERQRRCTQCNK